MESLVPILVIVVLVVIGLVAYRVFSAPGSGDMVRRASRVARSEADSPPAARQPTLTDLQPGDAISFWDGDDRVVDAAIECREEIGARTSRWRWLMLSGDAVLETAPDENVLYTQQTILYQGTDPFYALTAEPQDGGALKLFETRVREQSIGRNPVTVSLNGKDWTIESTGTFLASPIGPAPTQPVWADLSPNPSDNVYFELRGEESERGLGIWTSHILLLEGSQLDASDVHDLYPGGGSVHA
jgi:hypothetical protein